VGKTKISLAHTPVFCAAKTQPKGQAGQTSYGWPQKPQQSNRSQESGAGAKSGAGSRSTGHVISLHQCPGNCRPAKAAEALWLPMLKIQIYAKPGPKHSKYPCFGFILL